MPEINIHASNSNTGLTMSFSSTSTNNQRIESKVGRKRRRILVVDDEMDVTKSLMAGLEESGLFEVNAFANPESALKNFQPGFYDFLLIDIEMPGMGGHELYDRLKEIDRKVKSCFITKLQINYDAIRELFPTLEMECYIKIPINTDDLIKRIKKELKEG